MTVQTRKRRNKLLVPLLIILGLMVFMVLYTTRVIQDVAVSNIQEVGEDRISSVAAQLDNYLERTRSALWVTADTVDFMLRRGSTTAQIEDYIVEETTKQARKFDDNYTGFYAGIIMSILLGIQFILQGGYDSAFLFFLVFIPFQMMSIYKWSRNKEAGGASFEPKFLDTPRLVMSIAMLVIITAGDYVLSTFALMHDGLTDNMPVKILNGLLISSSFLANYWLIYRKTDSWIYWFIYSVSGIGLFIILGNVFSIVLFTFFLVINSMAGLAWIKGTSKENLNWVKIFVK